MKRTDAQRAFFQGLPVRWGTQMEQLGFDGLCREMAGCGCRLTRPLIFDINSGYDTGWEIDVGEGYRLIDPAEEELCDGDKVWYYPGRKWITKDSDLLEPFNHRILYRRLFFRRKVEAEREPEGACANEGESAINIIFDGPPSQESGRFVEVEKDDGTSINVGEWIERPDGLWALRITHLPTEEDQP